MKSRNFILTHYFPYNNVPNIIWDILIQKTLLIVFLELKFILGILCFYFLNLATPRKMSGEPRHTDQKMT